MESSQFSEAVYLLVDGQVAAELTYDDFLAHVEQQTELSGAPSAACVCRACYLLVGPGLQIAGLVFFLLQVDDQGRPDKGFNVPLPYLAKNAGPGPDLGQGPVPMACRGSCSVPWHANNLWDPTQDMGANPLAALSAAVAANGLGFTLPSQAPAERLRSTPMTFDIRVPENLAPGLNSSNPKVLIEELSAQHYRQLMDLQARHEAELELLRADAQARTVLYQQEIAQLREVIARLQPPTLASRSAGSRLD